MQRVCGGGYYLPALLAFPQCHPALSLLPNAAYAALRGAMGNLVRIDGAAGAAAEGAPHVHGVLHRLTPAEYAKLANMEHEYR